MTVRVCAHTRVHTCVWGRVPYIPDWPQTPYVAEDGLGFLILLPPPLESWDSRKAWSRLVYVVLGNKPRILCPVLVAVCSWLDTTLSHLGRVNCLEQVGLWAYVGHCLDWWIFRRGQPIVVLSCIRKLAELRRQRQVNLGWKQAPSTWWVPGQPGFLRGRGREKLAEHSPKSVLGSRVLPRFCFSSCPDFLQGWSVT